MRRKNIEIDFSVGSEELAEPLADSERQAIMARADLRRLSQEFKVNLLNLTTPEKRPQSTEDYSKHFIDDSLLLVKREASGEASMDTKAAELILSQSQEMIFKANIMGESAPGFKQLSFATLAEAAQVKGEDYSDFLRLAKEAKDERKKELITKPADLLPDAIILGIQKRELANSVLPEKNKIAKSIISDEKLLRAYGLVLPEAEREEFLSLVPEAERQRVSIIFDRELSPFLNKEIISNSDADLQEKVRGRGKAEMAKAIKFEERELNIGLMKKLAETLSQLADEDSSRLLQEMGLTALAGGKELEKNRLKISYAARIIRELSEIDQNKGGNLAMKFLAKREVPNRLFVYFCKRLMSDDFLTKKLGRYFEDKANWPFLRKLFAEYPNQFNTVIDTISQIPDYQPADNQADIFGAVRDIGSLTPIIFNRYRQTDEAGKKELAWQIKELKPKFFRNQPIKDILPKKDREILAEMVYLAYNPVNMSYEQVKGLIEKVDDQSGDLSDYNFPEDGYDFTLSTQKSHVLKEGETIELRRLINLRQMLNIPKAPEKAPVDETAEPNGKKSSKFSRLAGDLAKAKTEFKLEEVGELLGLISQHQLVADFVGRYQNLSEENIYNFLTELQEILGIYFKDNFETEFSSYFLNNPEDMARAAKILASPDRQKVLARQLGKEVDFDWQKISEPAELARILSAYFSLKAVKPLRQEIVRNLKKFEEKGGGRASVVRGGLKAYISKNVGSFFAKASAGICTASDIPLFERDDHFHINIVENDENVRGNIQAYVIKESGGGRSLVLRGFNPNSKFVERINVAAFCEKVLAIGRQFCAANGFEKIYITEQGGWHALSNRGEVEAYLRRYFKTDKAKNFKLQVASSSSIDTIYEV